MSRLPFLRNSTSHCFLLLAESQGRAKGYVTCDELMEVFPKFSKPYKVRESAKHLESFNLVKQKGEGRWAITPEGRGALNDLATRPPSKKYGRVERYVV